METTDRQISRLVQPFRFLIADPTMGAKNLRLLLTGYSVPPAQIVICRRADEALETLQSFKPAFLFIDLELGIQEMRALVELHRSKASGEGPRIVMLSGSQDQASILEESRSDTVVGHFLKPYTFQDLKTRFEQTVVPLLAPDPYQSTLGRARDLLKSAKLTEAFGELLKAIKLSKTPVEALVMLAEIYRTKGDPKNLIQVCRKALEFDSGNSQALSMLFSAHADLGEYAEADRILQAMLERRIRPAASLIPRMIAVARGQGRFAAIPGIAELHEGAAGADATTRREASRALLAASEELLTHGKKAEGLQLLRRAETLARDDVPTLARLLCIVRNFSMNEEAAAFAARMPREVFSDPAVAAMEQEVALLSGSPERSIEQALALIQAGKGNYRVHSALVRLVHEHSSSDELRKQVLNEACRQFPDAAETFRVLAEAASSGQSPEQ